MMRSPSPCVICQSPTRVLHNNIFDERHGYPGLFQISQCISCGFCRTDPSLSREDLSPVYREYYPRRTLTPEMVKFNFDSLHQKSRFAVWFEGDDTTDLRTIRPGSRVLDVGCGDCSSLLFAKSVGALEAIGIEVDSNIEPLAKRLGIEVYIGHLADLPEEKGYFDYICARQVLEHEPEPQHLLSEMKKRLTGDGRIILSFPNVNSLYRTVCRNKWIHWHVPYHVNHFSRRSVEELAKTCHLEILSIKTVTPNAWTHWQLRALNLKTEIGQRDTFWDPGVPNNLVAPDPKYFRFFPRWMASALHSLVLRLLADPFICVSNRFLDCLGLGESFIVILAK